MVTKRVGDNKPISQDDLKIINSPIKLPFSGITVRNRTLKAAMTEKISSFDEKDPSKRGIPTKEYLRAWEQWGQGGIGILLSGNLMVHPEHLEAPGNVVLHKPVFEHLDTFKQVVKLAKADGGVFVGQISHPGRQTAAELQPHPVSASDVKLESPFGNFAKPTPLTEVGIKEIVEAFGDGAAFLYKAGVDGVQIHGAHGYLISQFLAPGVNHRTDKYGGSLENRARIIFEIIDNIRSKVTDPKFIIGVKLNSADMDPDNSGFQVEDAAKLAKMFEDYKVDFLEISGGTYAKLAFEHVKESTKKREAFFLEFAEKIKPALSKTVLIVTGGFRSGAAMAEAIRDGSTDMCGIGRPLTYEPGVVKEILTGRVPGAMEWALDGGEDTMTTMQASYDAIKKMGNGEQIPDYSNKETVNAFKKQIAAK